MNDNLYPPEGSGRLRQPRDLSTPERIERAIVSGEIFESRCILCDGEHNLHIDLGKYTGIIPREECVYSLRNAPVKDIAVISRVGKSVCFKIKDLRTDEYGRSRIILSRRDAQRECMENYIRALTSGDVIDARVTHLEPFGAFVDVGCGIASLLSIDCISVSRISHPRDRFTEGQFIKAVVRTPLDERGMISVSHRELLGTWEENAALFSPAQTVTGTVRSVEEYGVFVELMPNLCGLAELRDGAAPGKHCAVYIKSIIPERMKIKLIIIDTAAQIQTRPPLRYFVDPDRTPHISEWRYSPECCPRLIETRFGEGEETEGTDSGTF